MTGYTSNTTAKSENPNTPNDQTWRLPLNDEMVFDWGYNTPASNVQKPATAMARFKAYFPGVIISGSDKVPPKLKSLL